MRKVSTVREDRSLQILHGALEVFSQKGFKETSIRDVAVAAGIQSPALIYHYFANKEELLRAVLAYFGPPVPTPLITTDPDALSLRDGLMRFAISYLKLMDDPAIGACMRVLIGEALRSPDFATLLGDVGPHRLLAGLSLFLRSQMVAGKSRKLDPDLAARLFLGPLFAQVFLHSVVRLNDKFTISSEQYAEQLVDIFLDGISSSRALE